MWLRLLPPGSLLPCCIPFRSFLRGSDDEKGDEERDYSPITDENIDDYFDNQRDDTESLDSTEDSGTPTDTTEQDTQKEDTTAESTENTEK